MNILDENIGIIFNFENGYLVEHDQVGNIQPEFVSCLELAKQKIVQSDIAIRSVYVTGAVAKGTAVKNVSDLDLAFVFDTPAFDKHALFKLWDDLIRIVPGYGLTHLDCKYLTIDEILSSDILLLSFKYQGFCLIGDCFAKDMERLSMQSCFMFRDVIFDQLQELNENRNTILADEVLTKYCRSIMKMILRTGMELVMEIEEKYSTDLYPCYKLFSKHYPAEEPIMKGILHLALNPTPDRDIIFDKIHWAESFFTDKIVKVTI